eukprot:jgi/Mesen1/10366/ME000080S09758
MLSVVALLISPPLSLSLSGFDGRQVVKREVCAILTRGTLVDGEMLEASPDAAYLMAVSEEAPAGSAEAALGSAVVGVCAVDAATGQFLTGQFLDDSARTRLRSLLSELRPVELVKPRGELSEAAERALRDHTRQPLVNNLDPGSEFWSAATTLRELERYFGPAGTSPPGTAHGAADDTEGRAAGDHRAKGGPLRGAGRGWPLAVRQLAAAGRQGEVALSALGACVWYLRQALLDHRLLAIRHFELLPGSDSALLVSRQGGEEEGEGAGDYPRTEGGHGPAGADLTSAAAEEEPAEPFMVLDSAALEGLEILENSADGAPTGTLLAQLDHCATPFGKRLLRTWLVRPLRRPEAIVERQTAVADLKVLLNGRCHCRCCCRRPRHCRHGRILLNVLVSLLRNHDQIVVSLVPAPPPPSLSLSGSSSRGRGR